MSSHSHFFGIVYEFGILYDTIIVPTIGVHDFDDWLNTKRFEYTPQYFRDHDVDIEVIACSVCGSDTHCASGAWGRPFTPLAVGHEIVGKIVRIGPNAKKGLKLGDRVGVGARVDCDDTCIACEQKYENNCRNLVTTSRGTYPETGKRTIGGNASHVRVNSKFAFKIPDSLETAHVAPLLCGGFTAFSPLLQASVGKGTKVGVSGIGGIGHMAILFAKALGAEVYAISRSKAKEQSAKELGADHFCATNDDDFVDKYKDTLDVLLNTSNSFEGSAFDKTLAMLRPRAKMMFITAPPMGHQLSLPPMPLLLNNISVQGSAIGSVDDIQYMLEFAAEHNIKPWVETVDISEENLGKTWRRLDEGDVKLRFTMVGYDKCFKQTS